MAVELPGRGLAARALAGRRRGAGAAVPGGAGGRARDRGARPCRRGGRRSAGQAAAGRAQPDVPRGAGRQVGGEPVRRPGRVGAVALRVRLRGVADRARRPAETGDDVRPQGIGPVPQAEGGAGPYAVGADPAVALQREQPAPAAFTVDSPGGSVTGGPVTTTVLRPAIPGEAAELTELILRSKAYWGYDEEFMARCRPALTLRPEDVEPHHATVAELGGRIAGVVTIAGTPPEGEIDLLFVDPWAIGTGVGRALYQHALA